MNFEEYQQKAHTTADYKNDVTFGVVFGNEDEVKVTLQIPVYPFLKAITECNEILDKIIKLRFRGDKIQITEKDIVKELGDILWYVSEMSTCLSTTLESVAEENIKKLEDRKNRNQIHGSGDNR